MQRVMIIGQPGSGKSTLARRMGEITKLPVIYIDHIHWTSGWIERTGPEKDALIAQVHARTEWIFEGGRSSTWEARLARADTLIWLDLPLRTRLPRVLWRTVRYFGRTRPDLPEGCPEQFSWEFIHFIWRTRHSSRQRARALFDTAPADKTTHHFTTARAVNAYLAALQEAVSRGNLGRPHR